MKPNCVKRSRLSIVRSAGENASILRKEKGEREKKYVQKFKKLPRTLMYFSIPGKKCDSV